MQIKVLCKNDEKDPRFVRMLLWELRFAGFDAGMVSGIDGFVARDGILVCNADSLNDAEREKVKDFYSVCCSVHDGQKLKRPFAIKDLVAAVNEAAERFSKPRLMLNTETLSASYGEYSVKLSRKEAGLLSVLLQNEGRTVSKTELNEYLRQDKEPCGNELDVYVRFLRKKLDEALGLRLIYTERGVGYGIKSGK